MEQFAYYESPFGLLKIGYTDLSITCIRRVQQADGPSIPSPLSDRAAKELEAYFSGARKQFDLPLSTKGTAFQQAVWAALAQIPYGETRTYQEIAAAIGNPKACRAVGTACNRNPIWIVIPCHRVIGANRSLTGYEGGLDMKAALLELEKAHR